MFLVICTGVSLWHVSSVKAVGSEEKNAREKATLIGTMLNKNLGDYKKSFSRIKSRLERVSVDNFLDLANVDMKNYTRDYEIIKGMLILDEKLALVDGNAFSEQFILSGMLSSKSVVNWLNTTTNEIRFAANSSTLDTDTPTIMFSIPVESINGDRYQILALLDMNLLIEKRYIDYLSSFDAFIELTPQVYFSVNARKQNIYNLRDLLSLYNNYIVEKVEVMGIVNHNIYSFINNYSALRERAKVEQVIIWLTFIFIYSFILASDSLFLLKLQSKKLFKMAKYDELTGLLRRDALDAEIKHKQSKTLNSSYAMVFLNLDGFNSINNSLGHALGDRVLKLVALRLKNNALAADSIARFGNHEFILFYSNTSKEKLTKEISIVLSSLADVYYLGDVDIYLTASAGISMPQEKIEDSKILLQHADIAVDHAKALGGNQLCFYHKLMDDKHKEIVYIRGELQKALKNGDLEVYYQPIHSLPDKKVVSVESLVRWKNGNVYISPVIFIPIAEQTGQILEVGKHVLAQVLNDMNNTPELKSITVAVNFSPQQLQQQGFINNLCQLISEKGIEPQRLTIEVTETVMSEKGVIEGVLRELMARGFNVAIDDFGTGYSSLSYLSRQPANIIKVDREFTLGAEQEGQERALLEAIIKICIELRKIVVIEGIEAVELIEYLFKFKSIRVQGYYYSKPIPLNELINYIVSSNEKLMNTYV
jgi:diguanylate cyclase (GGDEF)-like protein